MAEYLAEMTEGLIRLIVAAVSFRLYFKPGRLPESVKPLMMAIGIGFLVWGAFGIASGFSDARSSRGLPDPTTPEGLEAIAAGMAIGCPKLVDSETELTDVTTEVRTLVLEMKLVNVAKSNLDPKAFQHDIHTSMVDGVCSSPEMRDLLVTKGVRLSYRYSDSLGEPVVRIDIDSEDCDSVNG